MALKANAHRANFMAMVACGLACLFLGAATTGCDSGAISSHFVGDIVVDPDVIPASGNAPEGEGVLPSSPLKGTFSNQN